MTIRRAGESGRARARWRAAPLLLASAILGASAPARLEAQRLSLIRAPLQPTASSECPAAAPVTRPAADQRAQARRLGERAAQSLLGGELVEAREQLRRAVAIDPGSAELTYRLARTLEDLADDGGAADAYCRLRALDAPADARADAETRLAAIVARRGRTSGDAETSFENGISRFEAGDLAGADVAFSRAIAAAPSFAPAYYDRALTRLARGQAAEALADFDRFARLSPSAVDAELRRAQHVLRRGRFSPGTAVAAGLFPGGAQMYTGRPGLGMLVGLVAAAGAYLVMDGQEEYLERTAVDPFGNPYTFRDPNPTTAYPRRGIGLGVIGVAIVGGALEGFLHASQGRSAVEALRSRLRVTTAAR